MFDGIKIKCLGTNPKDWENNSLLKFASSVDVETGEILSNNKTAYYKGLYFCLIPSTVSDSTHCIIKGSLAKFHNNGNDNAFDYSIDMLQDTINELEKRFSVDPLRAEIQSFEYGVNVHPTQPIKQILNGLRAYQSDNFIGLKEQGIFNGKQLKRQEYSYKMYDKGLSIGKPEINLLRVEYAVNSIKTARKYNIRTLADLSKISVLNMLQTTLLEIWNEIIFYDLGMKWRYMTDSQKEKMLLYLDATNWKKFTKMQRLRAKEHFRDLHNLFCSSKTQVEIHELLRLKTEELIPKKRYHLRNFSETEYSSKQNTEMLPFTYLDKQVNGNRIGFENLIKIEPEKTIKKDEVTKPFSSYQVQKKTIAEYNRLAVQNYNAKYNL